MTDNTNAPVFADRYRFEPVTDDWDRGRSGYTHLVYDLKENRLGVIKRAETISPKSIQGLKNEVKALKALQGSGVPQVYDSSHAVFRSKDYDYLVIEYIDGIRIEKNLNSLSVVERVEIITSLFDLLSQAHQKGIVNGDVDLKHLFWRKDKKQLIVIDWGNARLSVNPKKKTEFAYDLARAAEIIFSLVARQGDPPATGSIALPDDSGLVPGLEHLPFEFRNLCKWAPRTPSESAQAPYTARELYEISKKWLAAVGNSKPYKPNTLTRNRIWLMGIPFLAIIFLVVITLLKNFGLPNTSITPTLTFSETSSPIPLMSPPATISTTSSTIIPTETITETPGVTPSPDIYSPILIFDNKLNLDKCWENRASSSLKLNEGFYRRDDGDWGFEVMSGRSVEDAVQVDFGPCLGNQQVGAVALNVVVNRLEIPAYESSREFGVFLENQSGQRREYMLWMDKNETMYLRIRENNIILRDDPILVVSAANLHFGGEFPRPYRQFPIQFFLEINNQGLDIVYLLESSLEKLIDNDINPNQMKRIDNAVLSTLGDVKKIGLVGRGGKTETLIWPLTLLERK